MPVALGHDLHLKSPKYPVPSSYQMPNRIKRESAKSKMLIIFFLLSCIETAIQNSLT